MFGSAFNAMPANYIAVSGVAAFTSNTCEIELFAFEFGLCFYSCGGSFLRTEWHGAHLFSLHGYRLLPQFLSFLQIFVFLGLRVNFEGYFLQLIKYADEIADEGGFLDLL